MSSNEEFDQSVEAYIARFGQRNALHTITDVTFPVSEQAAIEVLRECVTHGRSSLTRSTGFQALFTEK